MGDRELLRDYIKTVDEGADTVQNPVDPAHLTPDQSVVDMFKNDELAHDTGTLEGFAGMLDRAASIDSGSLPLLDASTSEGGPGGKYITSVILFRTFCTPRGEVEANARAASAIWAAHGTEDKICDFKGTERWMTEDCGVKDRTWRVYEGWLHRSEFNTFCPPWDSMEVP